MDFHVFSFSCGGPLACFNWSHEDVYLMGKIIVYLQILCFEIERADISFCDRNRLMVK